MKNLVKKAKRKRWIDVIVGLLSFGGSFFLLKMIPSSEDNPNMIVAMNSFMFVVCALFGFLFGVLMDLILFDKIIDRFSEIDKIRRIHHVRLIEKAIDDNNKEKAEELFFQFVNSKRKNINLCDHLSGAIRGKFYNKLELILLDDKKTQICV